MDWYTYMIEASEQSKFNAAHWFRYLRKVIFKDYSYLTDEDVQRLLHSKELTDFQKISLKYAVQPNTPTHDYVISLNKPAELTTVQKLMEKYKHG
ncbi:hypothetical protein NHG25_06800 [Aerococcaceae bacterium NML191292]|nr:hypothetical protein [Aerococcaceae bacterium NML210727]MCW6654273.1 hypothetical protein [Aerococcaceae bacterium NML201296]MCW6660186.1 hypothetical protein [Aerococcaceae bacterium NML191292]MCW6661048.1 hypothetical protein [Aerococcaceae bacterium NML201209]MCW6663562.1 hypothetical protein [Aerococcaceae bacterium NML190073]MCW6664106.1 hypothetical protein [Aerococcaceae bacterium NML191219]MCW6667060.1 hypothetical protein [Aerococcaceae bacterium NML190938]MCW6674541.1 hypothetic